LQHDQLMSERGILCFKSALGLEERGDQVKEEEYQRDHPNAVDVLRAVAGH